MLTAKGLSQVDSQAHSQSPKCRHWQDVGLTYGGECLIGIYAKPSFGACAACLSQRKGRLGTMMRKAIHWSLDNWRYVVGIRSRYYLGAVERVKACVGCGRREVWIDRMVPIG